MDQVRLVFWFVFYPRHQAMFSVFSINSQNQGISHWMGPINPWFVDDLGGYPILGRTHLSMAIQKNGWPEMVFNQKSTDFVDGFGFSGLKMETQSWRWINIICKEKAATAAIHQISSKPQGNPSKKFSKNLFLLFNDMLYLLPKQGITPFPVCLWVSCSHDEAHPAQTLTAMKYFMCAFSPTIPVPAGRSCCEYCWGNQWILIMTKRGNPELTTPNWSRFALKCLIQFREASHKARHMFGMFLSTDILGKWSPTSSRSQKKCR